MNRMEGLGLGYEIKYLRLENHTGLTNVYKIYPVAFAAVSNIENFL